MFQVPGFGFRVWRFRCRGDPPGRPYLELGTRNSEPETIHLRVISVWVIEMPSASRAWV